RSLAHDPIDCERELLGDLREGNVRNRAIAPPCIREQRMGVLDRAFASFDCDIHRYARSCVARTERGKAATAVGETRIRSTPRGTNAQFATSRSAKSTGNGSLEKVRAPAKPGPESDRRSPAPKCSTCRTSVVDRSGYSAVPIEKASNAGIRVGSAGNANAAVCGSAVTGAPVCIRIQSAT